MAQRITSIQNPRFKLAKKLREARQRKRTGFCIIEGPREVGRAIHSGLEIESLFVSQDFEWRSDTPSVDPDEQMLQKELREFGEDRIYEVTTAMMEQLTFGDRRSPVLAVARSPQFELDDLDRWLASPALHRTERGHQGWLILVLDRVEKPGNLGAALRTADAVGADAVILSDPECEPMNPNAIRASMGAIFTLAIAKANAHDVRRWLQERGVEIFAARLESGQPYTNCSFVGPTALVLGSEAHGVGTVWQDASISSVQIPMLGEIDSLNVSVAAGVLLYEALRQRKASSPDLPKDSS